LVPSGLFLCAFHLPESHKTSQDSLLTFLFRDVMIAIGSRFKKIIQDR